MSVLSNVYPNTLNLDPVLVVWSNLDADPGLCYQFCGKKTENNIFFKSYKKIMAPHDFYVSWVFEWWFYVFNFTLFASNLSYLYLCGSWIRIQSGSTTLIWLLIIYKFCFRLMCAIKGFLNITRELGPKARLDQRRPERGAERRTSGGSSDDKTKVWWILYWFWIK